MKTRRWFVLASVLILCFTNDTKAESAGETLASKIAKSLPNSWSVIERKLGVLPEGHYWGQKYTSDQGEEILLQGVADVHVSWQNSRGEWHVEVVGKETLKLYVMPLAYQESWLRFFIPQRPVTARLLVETQSLKVYAHPSFRIIEKEKLARITKEAKAIRWPDLPESTAVLSWATWRTDIARLLSQGT
ncbi:MAG: hypothetical protein V4795_01555 [Pseudomonadota bacterium]